MLLTLKTLKTFYALNITSMSFVCNYRKNVGNAGTEFVSRNFSTFFAHEKIDFISEYNIDSFNNAIISWKVKRKIKQNLNSITSYGFRQHV